MPGIIAPLDLPLFELLPDALVIVDRDGKIAMANGNAHALFGYSPGELIGREVEALVPSDARGRHRAHRDAYMARPSTRAMGGQSVVLSGQRKDGRQFPVDIALSPVETPRGLHFMASIRDISESQRVRQALVRARYDALLAALWPRALGSGNAGDFIAQVPRLLAGAIGGTAAGIVDLSPGDPRLRVAFGDGADEIAEWLSATRWALEHVLAGKVLVVPSAPGESPAPAPGMKHGIALVPLQDEGATTGVLFAAAPDEGLFDHDALQLMRSLAHLASTVLQRKRYEEQLAHAQRIEALGQLTGGVAHDFNNLLTVVSGSLQLLERECADRPDAVEIIGSALRSVGRGADLTHKLLAFARRQHLSPDVIAPGEVLADLQLMLGTTLGEGIDVVARRPPDLPSTYADASQLDNALLNLALNARDAMPGGGTITIEASERWLTADPRHPARVPGHYVCFAVRDTGHGMAPDVLARAFEPFFTTKGPRLGSGLGLSMVYGFVRQSGGFVEIQSRKGAGTLVEMYLPASTGKVPPRAPAAPPRIAAPAGAATILLVEDEDDVRQVAKASIEALGFQVLAAADAAAALALLDDGCDVALLFTDVMLGAGMNGIELAKAALATGRPMGVLLASGYDPVSTTLAEGTGFELLCKPYRLEGLAEAIQRQLPARGDR